MYKIFLNLYVDLNTCIYFFFQIKGSNLKYGISLRTLIRKSAELSGPCLLITRDTRGAVFGGLLNCQLTPTPKRKYQGTYETFVFTMLYGAPRLFRPTGANRYFYICLNDMLALGGGGNFALYLNEDLLTVTSGHCDTFGNQCLAHDESFTIKNVELWKCGIGQQLSKSSTSSSNTSESSQRLYTQDEVSQMMAKMQNNMRKEMQSHTAPLFKAMESRGLIQVDEDKDEDEDEDYKEDQDDDDDDVTDTNTDTK